MKLALPRSSWRRCSACSRAAPGVAQSGGRARTAESRRAQSKPAGRGPGCGSARSIRTGAIIRSIRVPYDIEYPGPNGKRECVDAYVDRASPERHSDRAADALPVGARLAPSLRSRTLLSRNLPKPQPSRALTRTGRVPARWVTGGSTCLNFSQPFPRSAFCHDRTPWRGQRQRANWRQHEELEFDRGQLGAASLPRYRAIGITDIGRTTGTTATTRAPYQCLRL